MSLNHVHICTASFVSTTSHIAPFHWYYVSLYQLAICLISEGEQVVWKHNAYECICG